MHSRLRLPRVYPITDVQISGLSHGEQVRLLSEGGATLVQLREKKMPALDFYNDARAAIAIAAQKGIQLIINDRTDVALAIGANSVHLGQDDLPPEAARKLLGDQAVIGYSTHNVAQASAAVSLPVDYVAIGPIFKTTSKTDPSPEVGLEGLRAVRRAVGDIPLVAIGGITLANAAAVIEAGADSVAVISAVISDPARISKSLRAFLQTLPPVRPT
jgi:thiamine-phosphate pyrophosphorylase